MSGDRYFVEEAEGGGRYRAQQMASDGGSDLLDRLFDALGQRRRRYALYYLQEYGTADLDALATQVAAWETDKSSEEISNEEFKRVLISLYHSHIPKLTEAGIVEYDKRNGSIKFLEAPEFLRMMLVVAADLEGVKRLAVAGETR